MIPTVTGTSMETVQHKSAKAVSYYIRGQKLYFKVINVTVYKLYAQPVYIQIWTFLLHKSEGCKFPVDE